MSGERVRAGIIGAGNMGGRMGRRVAAAGDAIVAFDVSAETLATALTHADSRHAATASNV